MKPRTGVRVGWIVARALGAVALASVALADCVPVVAPGSVNINGIVVGQALGGGGAPPGTCLGDAGWGGVVALTVPPVSGVMDTHKVRLFVSGRASGANLDRLYLGLHVENDDSFTSADIIIIYVDANANSAFDAGDFALRVNMGPPAPPTDESCNGSANSVELFQFSGGEWANLGAPPAGSVTVRTSWDYSSAPDVERDLWEIEVEVVPGSLPTPATIVAASGIRLGARMFLDVGGLSLALAFPAGVTTTEDPSALSPNEGGVTAANLRKFDVGTCANDVEITAISGMNHVGTPERFTRYNPGDFNADGSLDPSKQNQFRAQVRMFNPANPADMSSVAVPNSGKVQFHALPYSSGFTADVLMGQPTVSIPQLGVVHTLDMRWPPNKTEYDKLTSIGTADHVCYRVLLNGFTVNLNEPGDVRQQNLTFTSLSTVKKTFQLVGPTREGQHVSVEYLLRPRWRNVPERVQGPPDRPPQRGRWSYRFLNAATIGLKPVRGGFYLVELKPGESKEVEIEITGAAMPMQTLRTRVGPRAGGAAVQPPSGDKPVTLPVKPGTMLTLVASGLVAVDPSHEKERPTGPEGYPDRRFAEFPMLMGKASAFVGWENVGALIGSFDAFKTAFRIGGATSVVVPDRATRLYLAVNDIRGLYGDNKGRGYDVRIVVTDPFFLPTRLTEVGIPAVGLPGRGELGANMPQLNIDLLNLDARQRLVRPAGYVSFAAFDSR